MLSDKTQRFYIDRSSALPSVTPGVKFDANSGDQTNEIKTGVRSIYRCLRALTVWKSVKKDAINA